MALPNIKELIDSGALSPESIKKSIQEFNFASIKPYLMDTKTLGALALLGFAMYTSFFEFPAKIDAYYKAKTEQEEAQKVNSDFEKEKGRLDQISKALDKVKSRPIVIDPGQSPEIACIDVAQKVSNLAEQHKNIYQNLNSLGQESIPVVEAANIPLVHLPEDKQQAQNNLKSEMNAYRYNLDISGSYSSLVQFINTINQLENTVIIVDLNVVPYRGNKQILPSSGDEQLQREVDVKMTFLVPWVAKT